MSSNSSFDGNESETNGDALLDGIKVFKIVGMFGSLCLTCDGGLTLKVTKIVQALIPVCKGFERLIEDCKSL